MRFEAVIEREVFSEPSSQSNGEGVRDPSPGGVAAVSSIQGFRETIRRLEARACGRTNGATARESRRPRYSPSRMFMALNAAAIRPGGVLAFNASHAALNSATVQSQSGGMRSSARRIRADGLAAFEHAIIVLVDRAELEQIGAGLKIIPVRSGDP
jgi:hypothetical protein